MLQDTQPTGEPLYSNVRVGSVAPDPASGELSVKVIFAEREVHSMLYEGVLYSQLNENAEGKRIALAIELSPDEYRNAKHRASSRSFQEECRLNGLDSLDEMIRRGYRIFTHYVGDQDECVVIAKRLNIS